MADGTASLRQRQPPVRDEPAAVPKAKPTPVDHEERQGWILDVFRVLTFLVLASCGLSYLISNGESFFWKTQVPIRYLQPDYWMSKLNGPLYLTPEQLSAYDGSDPAKPIYLAINGTIYDVSANRRVYGPGGSYNIFTGADASRGYVTGCFRDDKTPDMRGVEEMFLPIDDPEVDKKWSKEELARMKVAERKDAEKKAYDALKHWVDFFAKSKKYSFVGYVKRDKNWLEKEPMKELCPMVARKRQTRHIQASEQQ